MKEYSLEKQLPDGISIVICTYNGGSRLEPTLKAVFSLETNTSISWELIIIDNASTDNTTPFCEDLIEKYGFVEKTRLIFEPLPGCNHARRRGLNEAKYKWLLFCDDDNHLLPDYIQKAWPILTKNPSIGALGGQGIALFEDYKPEWFDRYSQSFAIGPQATKEGKINIRNAELYSAGTFFRKEVLMCYFDSGFSCLLVGRKGKEIYGGEDVEFCLLIQLLGYEIWYNSQLKFYHYMTSERMNWPYYLKLKDGISSTSAYFASYMPFFKKGKPTIVSFCFGYLSNYIFFHLVWLHFLVRSKIQPSRYSQEQLELGKVINRRKALSYRSDFRESFLHFKQLKKVLKILNS
jgi:glycosyltransferase involved in cell wall biosynthesis